MADKTYSITRLRSGSRVRRFFNVRNGGRIRAEYVTRMRDQTGEYKERDGEEAEVDVDIDADGVVQQDSEHQLKKLIKYSSHDI